MFGRLSFDRQVSSQAEGRVDLGFELFRLWRRGIGDLFKNFHHLFSPSGAFNHSKAPDSPLLNLEAFVGEAGKENLFPLFPSDQAEGMEGLLSHFWMFVADIFLQDFSKRSLPLLRLNLSKNPKDITSRFNGGLLLFQLF